MSTRIIKEARSLLDPKMIREWSTPNPRKVVSSTVILWAQLLSAWSMALFAAPIFWLPAFFVICACISAMQLWVHESSHFSLFRNRTLNDLWATLFFAGPIGMSVKKYRRFHMTHHTYLATPKDLDRFAFNVDIRGKRNLIRTLLRGLLCIDGYHIAIKKYLVAPTDVPTDSAGNSIFYFIIFNTILLICCVYGGRWYLYFLFWVYPILGVAVTVNTIRSIGEHQPNRFPGVASADQNITQIIRTTTPGLLEKWLMFQANFNYHFEHHLYPSVPASKLPEVHRHLAAKGFFHSHPELIQRSAVGKVFALSSVAEIKEGNVEKFSD